VEWRRPASGSAPDLVTAARESGELCCSRWLQLEQVSRTRDHPTVTSAVTGVSDWPLKMPVPFRSLLVMLSIIYVIIVYETVSAGMKGNLEMNWEIWSCQLRANNSVYPDTQWTVWGSHSLEFQRRTVVSLSFSHLYAMSWRDLMPEQLSVRSLGALYFYGWSDQRVTLAIHLHLLESSKIREVLYSRLLYVLMTWDISVKPTWLFIIGVNFKRALDQ
jgi:hypothetical protein